MTAGERSPDGQSATLVLRYRHHSQHGLSILEFMLVVSIVSVLVVYGASRMSALRVDLERAAVEHTLAAIRSALALEFATLLTQGKRQRIEAWEGGNPLGLFESRNVFENEAGAPPGPGDWSYDRQRGEVTYRPAYPHALTGDVDAVGRWRVAVRGGARPTGLELVTVEALPGVGPEKIGPEKNTTKKTRTNP